MGFISIFILGVIILAGAILLNIVASQFGILGWYDFLKNPSDATIVSLLWLFIFYPLGLGLFAFYGKKIIDLIF